MTKKVAICLRGKCLDSNINCKNNKFETIDYRLCIDSIKKYIIDANKDYEFDFYLHGWVENLKDIPKIIDDYKPKKYILELQKNFYKNYSHLKNYKEILQERYKHIDKKELNRYNNIYFQNYFQNIFSYAYSISKSMELVPEHIDYEIIISLRYDCFIISDIQLNSLDNNTFYIDDLGISHSHLFYGDFIAISKKQNMLNFKNFFNFLKNSIYNDSKYITWTLKMKEKGKKRKKGRYEHGIYSNQMIYSYFLSEYNIKFNIVKPLVKCFLQKIYKSRHF